MTSHRLTLTNTWPSHRYLKVNLTQGLTINDVTQTSSTQGSFEKRFGGVLLLVRVQYRSLQTGQITQGPFINDVTQFRGYPGCHLFEG